MDTCFDEYYVQWRPDLRQEEIAVITDLGREFKFLIGDADWIQDSAAYDDYLGLIDEFLDDPLNAWALNKDWVLDIEPHTLPAWSVAREQMVTTLTRRVEQFIDSMNGQGSRALNVIAVLPHFYSPEELTLIADSVDEIIFMGYRDVVSDDNSNDTVLGLLEPDLDNIGIKPYKIALETLEPGSQLEKITFFEEGLNVLLESIEEIKLLSDRDSFNGVVVHDINGFRELNS